MVPSFQGLKVEPWHRWLSFGKWYEEAIFKAASGRSLSRKNLIASLRNQDGGSHIDGLLRDENYVALKTDPDPRMRGEDQALPRAHYATMRQVAWELERSLALAAL